MTFPGGSYDYTDDQLPQQYRGYHDPVYDAPADQAEGGELATGGEFDPVVLSDFDLLGVGLPTDYFHGAGGPLDTDPQLEAFIDMIVRAEHYPVDVASGMAWRTYYGGTKFSDMSDHPAITGEKQPVPLSRAQCIAAGYAGGKCFSTAAGGLQINRPTWQRIRGRGGYLPDFSVASQREAGRRLLAEKGVPSRLAAGDFAGAVQAASSLWASLPGSTAGQGGKSLAQVADYFRQAGGALA